MQKRLTPVFIGGSGRSGTTIILNLLSRHPSFQASIPREIKYVTDRKGLIDFNFARPLREERSMKEFRNAIAGRVLPLIGKSNFEIFSQRLHGRWWKEIGKKGGQRGLIQGISVETLDSALQIFKDTYKKNPRSASRDFFYSLSMAQVTKPDIDFFGDSTPTNIINAKYIYQIFPEAKFINMVRDGRDVALSVSKERWGPATPEQGLLWWEKRVEHAHQSLTKIPHSSQLELRLENLVIHERDESYRALLESLGLEDHSLMRKYFNEHLLIENMHSGEWRNQVKDPESFGAKYQKILRRLASKGIFIAKLY